MTLDQLPSVRDMLDAEGLLAKKSFGQHFLLDLNVTRKIARLAGVQPGDCVLEVGPGPGGLTRALLEAGAHLVCVEMDGRFLPILTQISQAAGTPVDIIRGDGLKYDLAGLPSETFRIVANLPYNVGTPMLISWISGEVRPQSLTLMFQKEVAERIVAPPGSDAYGRLGVMSQVLTRARLVMDVPARAFTPPPRVDSAVVHLVPRADVPQQDVIKALEKVTAAGFGQRRKKLRSSLKSLGGEDLCRAAGLDPDTRAETVAPEGFLAMAHILVRSAV